MRVSLPENIVGRSAVLHFRRCHALAGAAAAAFLTSRFSGDNAKNQGPHLRCG